MFNARLFSRMKRGAYFINISRGGCVVTADLIAALRSSQLAGAGLDVAAPEPLPPDNPLWHMPNVLIIPHVATMARRIVRSGRRSCSRTVAASPTMSHCSMRKNSALALQTFYVKPYSCKIMRRCYASYKLSAQTTLYCLSCSM
jgi:phosphoglycerate dehydrogenase-like enzyme